MNKNELEKRINELMVSDCNIDYVIEDIEDAKDAEQKFTHHWITDIEHVEINLDTFELTNLSELNTDDIKKAYAIKEYNSKLPLNDICNNLLDKFYYYESIEDYKESFLEGNCWDDDLTHNDKIEIIENSIENLIETSWGYLENC